MSWNNIICVLFLFGSVTGQSVQLTTSTPTTTVRTLAGPTNLYPGLVITTTNTCRDVYIWWGDGSIDCSYLVTLSSFDVWDVHKNPEYWCNEYISSLSRCCATCSALRNAGIISRTQSGSTRFPNQLTIQAAVQTIRRTSGRYAEND